MTVEEELPRWWREDLEASRFARVIDELLWPVYQLLDRLDDHLDPAIAADAVVDWLASCFGIDAGSRQRAVLTVLAEIHRGWGTSQGLAALLAAYLGAHGSFEIRESGGTVWSRTPGTALPGSAHAELDIHITVPDPTIVDTHRLAALITSAVPAHVRHRVHWA